MSCEHPICTTGGPLSATCNDCATELCAQDPFCCNPGGLWDEICTAEVSTICLQSCQASIIDYGAACIATATQCQLFDQNGLNSTTMHCCPGASAMVGYAPSSDSLDCLEKPWGQGVEGNSRASCVWRSTSRTVDGKTMLACNLGEYMIGINSAHTRIGCCPYNTDIGERVDGDNELTQTSIVLAVGSNACQSQTKVHRCLINGDGSSELMTGLDIAHNLLICSTP
jgi:hypothetical protein